MSAIGIVHFGPGAFHRAHQADYVDRLLRHDPRWGIAAVSLRSRGTVDALAAQAGRYTLAILDKEISFRTIAAHRRFLGPMDEKRIRHVLQDPAVRIVSSTVTEKGYCLASDGTLDLDHPDIAHDLANPLAPISIVGQLALGFADRREERQPPFTSLCCDNMVANGKKLRAAVVAFAARTDIELARWIEGEAIFPDTMVDSITPASDERLRSLVFERTGSDDAIPVSREAYSAWVVENTLPPGSPDLASVGVTLAADVAAWEKAKLRILNGAHSALAYLGLALGHSTVSEAMDDHGLACFVESLIRDEVLPTLARSPLDHETYVQEIVTRFRNPAIQHKLAQIAWDGSQKLPYRLLDTVIDAKEKGRDTPRIAVAVAAWITFVERQAKGRDQLVDPFAAELVAGVRQSDPVSAMLAMTRIFPPAIAADAKFQSEVRSAYELLRADPRAVLASDR